MLPSIVPGNLCGRHTSVTATRTPCDRDQVRFGADSSVCPPALSFTIQRRYKIHALAIIDPGAGDWIEV